MYTKGSACTKCPLFRGGNNGGTFHCIVNCYYFLLSSLLHGKNIIYYMLELLVAKVAIKYYASPRLSTQLVQQHES